MSAQRNEKEHSGYSKWCCLESAVGDWQQVKQFNKDIIPTSIKRHINAFSIILQYDVRYSIGRLIVYNIYAVYDRF